MNTKITFSVMNVDSDERYAGSPVGRVSMPMVGSFDSPMGQAGQHLCPPMQRSEDCYLTPTGAAQDDSVRSNEPRYARGLAAPKKRDETLSTSPRNACARDADSPAICAFKLSPRGSDSGSTQGSPSDQSERQQAMNQLRNEWSAFTERIMAVEITPSRPGPLRA